MTFDLCGSSLVNPAEGQTVGTENLVEKLQYFSKVSWHSKLEPQSSSLDARNVRGSSLE